MGGGGGEGGVRIGWTNQMSDPMAIASSLSMWHKGGVGASGKAW